MSDEMLYLIQMRESIAVLDEGDRQGVDVAAQKIREVLALHNDHGLLAFALIGAELAVEHGGG